jgi:hypothetical protein
MPHGTVNRVMRGLDPRIHHASQESLQKRRMDRVKPGHDEVPG